jgi:hypothetical protein
LKAETPKHQIVGRRLSPFVCGVKGQGQRTVQNVGERDKGGS